MKVLFLILCLSLSACFSEEIGGEPEKGSLNIEANKDEDRELDKSKEKIELNKAKFVDVKSERVKDSLNLTDKKGEEDKGEDYTLINYEDGSSLYESFNNVEYDEDRSEPIKQIPDEFMVNKFYKKELDFISIDDLNKKLEEYISDLGLEGYELGDWYGIKEFELVEELKAFDEDMFADMDSEDEDRFGAFDYDDAEDTYILKYNKVFSGIPMHNEFFSTEDFVSYQTSYIEFFIDEKGIAKVDIYYPMEETDDIRESQIISVEEAKQIAEDELIDDIITGQEIKLGDISLGLLSQPINNLEDRDLEMGKESIDLIPFYKVEFEETFIDEEEGIEERYEYSIYINAEDGSIF